MTLDHRNSRQNGSIIIVVMVLLLVMTTMGVGLVYVSGRDSERVMMTVNHSASLHSAETCINNMIRWLERQSASGPPCRNSSSNQVCHRVGNENMDRWSSGGETAAEREKMRQRTYACDLYLRTAVASQSAVETGTGFDVGQGATYSGGAKRSKYFYRIVGNGRGPRDTSTEVEVTVSMIF